MSNSNIIRKTKRKFIQISLDCNVLKTKADQ